MWEPVFSVQKVAEFNIYQSGGKLLQVTARICMSVLPDEVAHMRCDCAQFCFFKAKDTATKASKIN